MSDREKVIKGLEEISDYFFSVYHHSKDREEINEAKDRCDAVENALALLKEQDEPIKPTLNESHSYVSDAFKCGKCGHTIRFHAKYCEDCGQAVKWE